MQSFFASAFGPAATLELALSNVAGRLTVPSVEEARGGGAGGAAAAPMVYVYSHGEDVAGSARVVVPAGKKLEHVGIKVELKGVVDLLAAGTTHEFESVVKELAAPGVLSGTETFTFNFPAVRLPYESYDGIKARSRYFIRFTITRGSYMGNLTKELEFVVRNVEEAPAADSSVKLEVGIEDCLHIEFEYDRLKYHLSDVVTGRVNFLLVRIRIKHMEVAVIRREASGPPGSVMNDSETLTRFEIMDGCPVRGEKIPIRLYLGGLSQLTPSYSAIGNLFNVRYFLNLVLIDEEDRRYFKQQEITLWRKELKAV